MTGSEVDDAANRILRFALPLAVVSGAALLLTVLWNSALATRFGASGELDAFWVGFALPKSIVDSVHLGVLVLLFMVVFAGDQGSPDSRWRIAFSVLNVVLVVTLIAIAALQVLAPDLVRVMGPGLDATQRRLATSTLRTVSWALAFTVLTGALAGVLNVHRRFLPFAAGRAVGLSFQVGFLLLAGGAWGLSAAVWAVLGGAFLTLLVCLLPALGVGFRYRPVIDFRGSEGTAVGMLLAALVGFAFLAFLNQASDRFFASLLGPGSISALEFAWRFEIPVSQVLSFSVAIPTFALFAVQAGSGRLGDFRETLAISVRLIALLVLPVVGFMTVLRSPLASVWFERGAFSEAASNLVASLLPFLAVVFICRALSVVLVFGLLTLGRSRALLGVLSAEVLANTALNLVLGRLMGVRGVALATALSIAVSSLYLWSLLLRHLGGFSFGALWSHGWKTIAVNLGAFALLEVFFQRVWSGGLGNTTARLPRLAATFIGFAVMYAGLCLLFGLIELRRDRGLPRLRLTPSEWARDGRESILPAAGNG